eukprot:g212.t1
MGGCASHASEDAPQLHLVGAKTSLETIVNEAVTPRAPKRFDVFISHHHGAGLMEDEQQESGDFSQQFASWIWAICESLSLSARFDATNLSRILDESLSLQILEYLESVDQDDVAQLPSILKILQLMQPHLEVVSSALELTFEFTRGAARCRQIVAQNDGIKAIVSTMSAHPGSMTLSDTEGRDQLDSTLTALGP